MARRQLGKIEPVDLRTIWQHEAGDFTPWLAEHLSELGEVLGLDLALDQSEAGVGSFAVDIVADTDSGVVVIENQLEQTDHSHLGQLLTYAAGMDARVLIWITPEFRDEHRAALDWLNHWTADEIELYGVVVRAIRIGNSPPALEFRAVAFPNTWEAQAKRQHSRNSNSNGWAASNTVAYREFFQPVVNCLRKLGATDRDRARARYSQSFPANEGIKDASFRTVFLPRDGGIASVEFFLGSKDREFNKRIFDALEQDRKEIEHEVGSVLNWEREDGRHWSAVRLTRPAQITDPPEQLAKIREWMVEMLPKLKEAFDPRMQEILSSDDVDEAM